MFAEVMGLAQLSWNLTPISPIHNYVASAKVTQFHPKQTSFLYPFSSW